ncbi:AAA family ATPase [Desulfuribacillus alkaliarsenatis]|uniref:Replication-associated recombination protein A n=1 Tax=Desulfuribacillus alkaliarsenatis TaxID=766136 RepID=A0A1E5G0R5_9FIRM|nr:AAA family ATPase [Desulfuribacillus alkaliarsenatis]OEF96319.1 AAA family ATPase [Desulfuribacillus alkaliarsenatis]
MDDLFTYQHKVNGIDTLAPLASRMRPRDFASFVGQEHIVGEGKLLRQAIELDRVTTLILYGPPGTGKTTLAEIISNKTSSYFVKLHAVTAGVKDIREVTQQAKDRKVLEQRKTTLFIDEIHHFNKSQQDALLPFVEDGTIILIGATTENPFFEVNSALLSRSMVFTLKLLTEDELNRVMELALHDDTRGYGSLTITIDDDARKHIISYADGDARRLLNAVELAVATASHNDQGAIHITLTVAEESIQRRAVKYDKQGDQHYDTISAFIKSVRGSDPDAAVYWLARMIDAGEDPRFIARRIVILASEDIGNADPNALAVAISAFQAFELVGMPEGRIPLAQAVTYLAAAPKSNAAYIAINKALSDVKELGYDEVPTHLRDASYKGAHQLGHGQDYLYPHNYDNHYVNQTYLPSKLEGKLYYKPSDNGFEKDIKEYLNSINRKR